MVLRFWVEGGVILKALRFWIEGGVILLYEFDSFLIVRYLNEVVTYMYIYDDVI